MGAAPVCDIAADRSILHSFHGIRVRGEREEEEAGKGRLSTGRTRGIKAPGRDGDGISGWGFKPVGGTYHVHATIFRNQSKAWVVERHNSIKLKEWKNTKEQDARTRANLAADMWLLVNLRFTCQRNSCFDT